MTATSKATHNNSEIFQQQASFCKAFAHLRRLYQLLGKVLQVQVVASHRLVG